MRRDKRFQETASFIAQSFGRSSSSKRTRPWQLFLPANTTFSATPECVSPSAELDVKRLWRLSLTFVFLRRFIISPTIRSPQPSISKKGWFPPPFYPLLFLFFQYFRIYSFSSFLCFLDFPPVGKFTHPGGAVWNNSNVATTNDGEGTYLPLR